jgi:3,5-epimerase/4-reductase
MIAESKSPPNEAQAAALIALKRNNVMSQKIAIFGAGYLGQLMSERIPGAVLSRADITDRATVRAELARLGATAAVNCAGKTGRPNVDWCESHRVETMRGNVEGPIALAEVCAEKDVYLLHLGSGCIFYGDSPAAGGWREEDFANPTSFYSRSKYAADLLLSRMPNVGIVRLRMPIGSEANARNLITKLAAYRQVVDVENSVTIVDDLAELLAKMLPLKPQGIFHGTNPGAMRHRDLLALYQQHVDPAHKYELISEAVLNSSGLVEKARSNCILASDRLAELGLQMRPIGEALADTMRKYAADRKRQ